jgi:transcriptional regulator with XRE-family HTH domain
MNVNDRLKKLIEELGYNPTSFSKALGLKSNVQISNIVSGRLSKPSFETLELIHSFFDNINFDWLITGRGDRYITINSNISKGITEKTNDRNCSLYYYTTAKTLLKILGDSPKIQIKYSDFNKANDPKERMFYKHLIEYKENDKTRHRSIEKAKEELSKYKFISFCKQSESDYFTGYRVTLPRMWSQYGTSQNKDGNYNKSYMDGACIELDLKTILSKSEHDNDGNKNRNGIVGLSFFDINYKPENEYYNLYYKNNINIEDDIKFKYEHWKEECEFRAIYLGDDEYLDITDSIKRIYLGEDLRHENVIELCKIMAQKRYENIDPTIFTRITIGAGGLLYNENNNGGMILDDMMEIISKISTNYYDSIISKYSMDNNIVNNFYSKKLKKEQEEDEEVQKLNVDYYKDKYQKISEKYILALEENRDLRIKIDNIQKNFA